MTQNPIPYKVIVSFNGDFEVEVEAKNRLEAQQKAKSIFYDKYSDDFRSIITKQTTSNPKDDIDVSTDLLVLRGD